jgi:hypothetical protein
MLISMGMNYLTADGVLVILLTSVSYVPGHWWTFTTAPGGGGRYSPSTNTSEQADLNFAAFSSY